MNRPPASGGTAPFVLYAWRARPVTETLRALPAGAGTIALPIPLTGGSPQPLAIFNNIGRPGRLGAPTVPSQPAPSLVVSRPQGIGRALTLTLQGIIADAGSPNGRAAVTNGVVLAVR